MYDRSTLTDFSRQHLLEVAQKLDLAGFKVEQLTKAELIDKILGLQRTAPPPASSFETPFSDPQQPGVETSQFLTNSTDAFPADSQFENSDSSFVHEEEKKDSSPTSSDLTSGDTLTLKGITYTIKGIISTASPRAIIYQIQDPNGKVYALKLYRDFEDARMEPRTETLRRIHAINHPHLLRLYDYGAGEEKFEGKHCFEISDFALGSDLTQATGFRSFFSPKWVEDTLIPAVFGAMRALHQQKIFHGDLKPANIFFLDDLRRHPVIGDYGTAKTMDMATDQTARLYSEYVISRHYAAPEQTDGVMSEKSDYFALGMILIHLLYPEHFGQEREKYKVDQQKFRRIRENLYSGQELIPFRPEFKRFNQLIQGLLIINPERRWGAKEVENWLQPPEAPAPQPETLPKWHQKKQVKVFLGVIAVALLISFIGIMTRGVSSSPTIPQAEEVASSNIEDSVWREAQVKGTYAFLKQYLDQYPNGNHRDEAEEILSTFDLQPLPSDALLGKAFVGTMENDGFTISLHLEIDSESANTLRAGWTEALAKFHYKNDLSSETIRVAWSTKLRKVEFLSSGTGENLPGIGPGRIVFRDQKLTLEPENTQQFWSMTEM